MFNRIEFKMNAKQQLKGKWKVPVLATLVIALVTVIFAFPIFYTAVQETIEFLNTGIMPETNTVKEYINYFILLIITSIFSIAFNYICLELIKNTEEITFHTFLQGLNLWFKGITVKLWATLWIFIWTVPVYALLFFGDKFLPESTASVIIFNILEIGITVITIIKNLSYSQAMFIAAENPCISTRKTLKMSIAMTNGYKWELFVLAITFIGWMIVTLISYGIAFLFFNPYMEMTYVNCYQFLKKDALTKSTLLHQDFGMTKPIDSLIPTTIALDAPTLQIQEDSENQEKIDEHSINLDTDLDTIDNVENRFSKKDE